MNDNNTLKLAIFDIDGTLRRVRDPWCHLHDHLGVTDKADGFIELWERSEITYADWAKLDASLWRGFSRETIVAALETSPLRGGARELVGWFTARAIPCVGISTGLSIFNDITARELGFDEIICNELHFKAELCSGAVSIRVREDNKADIMDEVLSRYSATAPQTVVFGDGSADIPMLAKAGLGIAICPYKDNVRNCTKYVIDDEPIDRAIALVEEHFENSAPVVFSAVK